MTWEHYLNGTLVSSPSGWDAAQQEVVRDFRARTLSVQYSGEVTFTLDGYRLLRDLFEQSRGCAIVEYEAYTMCGGVRVLAVKTNIILADCEWNLSRCEVRCSPVDDGIGARIKNNGKIPISPTATDSKNGEPVQFVAPIPLEVFVDAGTYQIFTRAAYDWLECIQHAVSYMSDGAVTVQSAWYNALPDDERLAIVSGVQLRTFGTTPEERRISYTWDDLFGEVAKKYNLWLYVTRDLSGSPVLRVEPEGFTWSGVTGARFPLPDDITQAIDRDQLWAAVKVGSTDGISNRDAVDPLPFLVLQGFSEEAFHFQGVCNTEQELDLVSKWGICTNLINRVAILGNTQHDDLPFIIQYDRNTNRAVQWSVQPGVFLYNPALTNVAVLNRYPLPSDVGANFDGQDDAFRAAASAFGTPVSVTTPGITSGTVSLRVFDDDATPPNLNPNGTWDTAQSRYIAPVQGFYEFRVLRLWEVTAYTWPQDFPVLKKGGISRIIVQHRDSTDALISEQVFTRRGNLDPTQPTPVGKYNHEAVAGFVMDATDYVEVRMAFDTDGGQLSGGTITMVDRPGSFVETQFVASGGGTVTSADADAARIITLSFDRHVDAATWAALTQDPTLAVEVGSGTDGLRIGHILKAENNILKGTASFTLLTKRDQL